MTEQLIGYQLLDADNNILQSWGGSFTQTPEVPNRIDLPNGDQVFCPSLDTVYEGCYLTAWMATPPLPDLLPYQFFAELEISGNTAALDAFVAGLPSPQNIIARAKLDRSLSFQRTNDLVLAAQAALGISDANMDALWIAASQL